MVNKNKIKVKYQLPAGISEAETGIGIDQKQKGDLNRVYKT